MTAATICLRVRFACRGSLIGLWLLTVPPLGAEEPGRPAIEIAPLKRAVPVDFEREVLPILKSSCLACHNQTTAKADLILETPASILKGGESGPAARPKHGADSLLIKFAAHQKKPFMPPKDNKAAAADLTPEELGLLKLWIDQGARASARSTAPIAWQPVPEGWNPIYALALAPDGQFAACGRANQIFLYHLPSAQLVTKLNDPALQKTAATSQLAPAHRDMVNALAFNPDGQLLASGGFREVKLWRRAPVLPRITLAPAAKKTVTAVAASADGKWLATGGDDGAVKLWNAVTGKPGKPFPRLPGGITSLEFSPDSAQLLLGVADKSLQVVSVAGGKISAQAATEANRAVWLPDGRRLATAGNDGVIQLWSLPEAPAAALIAGREWKGHANAVTSLAVLPGQPVQLISGGADGAVRVWDLARGQMIREVKPGGAVLAVAARPDGKIFASAGDTNSAKLWDAKDGRLIAELRGDRHAQEAAAGQERTVAFAKAEVIFHQGALKTAETNLAAAAGRVKKATEALAAATKPVEEKQKILAGATEAKAMAEKALEEFAPAKKAQDDFAAAGKAVKEAEAELKKLKEAAKPDAGAIEKAAADLAAKAKAIGETKALADKLAAATGDKQKQANDKFAAATKTFDDAQKEFKKVEQAQSQAAHELELAGGAAAKATNVVAEVKQKLLAGEELAKKSEADLTVLHQAVVAAEKPIRTLAFSADNRTLATAGDDRAVHTWSAETGVPFEVYRGHKGAVVALAFAPDGTVVSGGADRSALVWGLNSFWWLERVIGTGEVASQLAGRVNAVRFSPDGQTLATGGGEPTRGGEIKLWEVATGRLARSFTNVHSDAVFALDFSADGKFLASGAADKFARVIELATGKVVKSLEGHTHHVLGVSWKRDGRTLITAGADGVVKVWDAVTGERRKNIEGFSKEVTSVSFIPGTDQALASGADAQIRAVRENGETVRSFGGAADFVNAAAVTSDGRLIIAGGQDGVLRVWNGTNGQAQASFAMPK